MRRHLAVFAGDAAEKILTGQKSIDIRLSQIKIPPFGKVSAADVVWMRRSGQKLVGSFVVEKVVYFDHPAPADVERIKREYGKETGMIEQFWQARQDCKYLSLIFIASSTRFLVSPQIDKKDRRSWVVL